MLLDNIDVVGTLYRIDHQEDKVKQEVEKLTEFKSIIGRLFCNVYRSRVEVQYLFVKRDFKEILSSFRIKILDDCECPDYTIDVQKLTNLYSNLKAQGVSVNRLKNNREFFCTIIRDKDNFVVTDISKLIKQRKAEGK